LPLLIVPTQYSQRDDQAELAWAAWLYTSMLFPQVVAFSCRATSLMCPTTLALSILETASDNYR